MSNLTCDSPRAGQSPVARLHSACGRLSSIDIIPGERHGRVRIPSSKSVVHRLLICAALGNEKCDIALDGFSKDILATVACLQALGAEIGVTGNTVHIQPVASKAVDALLRCGESGSTLRFLLPVAGSLGAEGQFLLEGRLPQRPMQAYEDLLRAHGMNLRREDNRLFFGGQLRPGDYRMPGDVSSQYFSGLLLSLPRLRENSTVRAERKLESEGYIRMTEDALTLSGVAFTKPEAHVWEIPGRQQFRLPSSLRAEGDWSNAAFFLCVGAMSEKGITVEGLNLSSSQGDRAVMDILKSFGAEVVTDEENGRVTVRKGTLKPMEIDASPVPDLIPVLSVLGCAVQGETKICNAYRLRLKESDRLKTTAKLITDLGGKVEELPDGLIIHGTGHLTGGTADSCNDHRIAMSAAAAACICSESVTVEGSSCVEKSYPAFWDDFGRCET